MPKFQVAVRPIASLVVLLLVASQASAQATRTWVSGVGDDVNPCSRTAPCKTFAGAISKTATGGEINCIDSGGFGAVTITKSITIDGNAVHAGILAAGTNGIIVNAASDSKVTLRNLSINGVGTGLNGIRYLNADTLHIENCTIFGFSNNGIDVKPAPVAAQTFKLFVDNTVIRNCPNTAAGFGAGILIKPGANGTVNAMLNQVRMNQNVFGLRSEDRTTVTVRDSEAAFNSIFGIAAVSNPAAATINLESCVVSSNNTGIRSAGVAATVRISNVMVVNNTTEGLSLNGGGAIVSFVNNRILGNTPNGTPTATQVQQ